MHSKVSSSGHLQLPKNENKKDTVVEKSNTDIDRLLDCDLLAPEFVLQFGSVLVILDHIVLEIRLHVIKGCQVVLNETASVDTLFLVAWSVLTFY